MSREASEPLELRQLTVGEARCDAMVALALDRVIAAAAGSAFAATVALDEQATVDELRIWADRLFTDIVNERRPALVLAGALYVLLAAIGSDAGGLLVGVRHAVRAEVMRSVRDGVVRRALAHKESGASGKREKRDEPSEEG